MGSSSSSSSKPTQYRKLNHKQTVQVPPQCHGIAFHPTTKQTLVAFTDESPVACLDEIRKQQIKPRKKIQSFPNTMPTSSFYIDRRKYTYEYEPPDSHQINCHEQWGALAVQSFSGNVWTSGTNKTVHVLSPDNLKLPLFDISKPQHSWLYPKSITAFPDGRMLVSSFEASGRLFDPSGRVLRTDFIRMNFYYTIYPVHILFSFDEHEIHAYQWNDKFVGGYQRMFSIQCDERIHSLCVDMNGYLTISYSTGFLGYSGNSRHFGSYNMCIIDIRKIPKSATLSNLEKIQIFGQKETKSIHSNREPDEFVNHRGMCVDDENTLMLVDRGNDRVLHFPMMN